MKMNFLRGFTFYPRSPLGVVLYAGLASGRRTGCTFWRLALLFEVGFGLDLYYVVTFDSRRFRC